MKLLYLDPRVLEADPNGVREDPGNVDGLAATISEHGLLQPLGVLEAGQGRYRVVYGNRRREAALQLGLERVPVVRLTGSDIEATAYSIADNRTHDFASLPARASSRRRRMHPPRAALQAASRAPRRRTGPPPRTSPRAGPAPSRRTPRRCRSPGWRTRRPTAGRPPRR